MAECQHIPSETLGHCKLCGVALAGEPAVTSAPPPEPKAKPATERVAEKHGVTHRPDPVVTKKSEPVVTKKHDPHGRK